MPICVQCSASLADGARFCSTCGAPAEPEPAVKERKLATVLFADLVGSTELGGSLDPEHTRDLLDRFYDAMAAEIALGGGTVEKFIGDAVVAVFGAPAAREDHAERALDAALSMQLRLSELFGERLALRIGVNTGEVVVGRPREGSSFVTGDPVNVAARLEQIARPGQILVGERTAAAVRSAFEFAEPITVQAKGKPGGVVCRELVRMVSPTRPRGIGLDTAFVGREQELAALERELEMCTAERRPRCVSLVGEPGVGKTSLVREFRARLPVGTAFHVGRCISYGRGVTYSPLADILRVELGLLAGDTPETVRGKLAGRDILGLTLGLDVGGDLDPRGAAERLRAEWVDLVTRLARTQPVVLVVEDLHWASEPLSDLLERLVAEVDGPLLLLVTTRPGRAELRGAGTTATLGPLTVAEAEQVLHRLLGAELSDAARGFLVRRADGNPFFLEELLSTLIDRGLLGRENGGWRLQADSATLDIPDSVQALLAARIDLLSPGEKVTLQAASVIGRTFTLSALAALAATTGNEVGTLVARGFLRQGEPELVFKHALTWEVVYASLPKAHRARLHASFAAWLEATGEGRDDQVATLAHHYSQAVEPEIASLAWRGEEAKLAELSLEALRYLRRGAELAVGRFDIDEALALLRQAVELAPEDAELWRAIARASSLRFDGEGYWEAMLKAVELTSDSVLLGELYAELAIETTMRGAMWKQRPETSLISNWTSQALELAAPESRAHAQALLANANVEDDVALADQAIAIAERLRDDELLSYGFDVRAGIALVSSEYTVAQDWAQRRLALAPGLTDPDHLALIHWQSSVSELAAGQLDLAESHARRHEAIAARLTPHHAVHALFGGLHVEKAAGRWEQIHALQPRAEQVVAENVETPCVTDAQILLVCAEACAELGLEAETERLTEEARAFGFEGYGLWLDPMYARLALVRGNLDDVSALLEGSEQWHWLMYDHVHGAATRLEALVAVGRNDDAEAEALRLMQPGSYLEPFALRALGLVRSDRALLAQAVERFEVLGLEWHASKTRTMAVQAQPLRGGP